jgi:predicted transcriptional regulator
MTLREDLYHLVDQLAETELEKARRLLEVLNRDVDDDAITEEEMAEIRRGAEQVERGEYVTLDELNKDVD